MTDDYQNNDAKTHTALPVDEAEKEASAVAKGRKRSAERREASSLSATNAGQSRKEKNLISVAEALDGFVKEVEESKGGRKPKWFEFVPQMQSTMAAEIALTICMDGLGKDWTLNQLLHQAGQTFHTHLFHVFLTADRDDENSDERRTNRRLSKQLDERARKNTLDIDKRREWALQKAEKKGHRWAEWQPDTTLSVGAILVSAVFKGCDLFENQLLDIGKILKRKGKASLSLKSKFIGLTPEAEQDLEDDNLDLDGMSPLFAPMLTPPNPWSTESDGPYKDPALARLVPMIKRMGDEQKAAVNVAMENGQLEDCVAALNTLQSVPYVVNGYVLDAVKWVMAEKLYGKIEFPNLIKSKLPKRMSEAEFVTLSSEEQQDEYNERNDIVKSNREAIANKINITRHCKEAEELQEFEEFYLPHQFDSRGRVYHTSEFGHHTTDYLRGMFLFKNQTLVKGNEGFQQLQIANTYGNGIDKEPYQKRIAWVEKHAEAIYRTGEDFKASFPFWKDADDPFQFLAACHDFYLFTKDEDGHKSGLPIGLDATQSGLQHYAAASMCEVDGLLVNLVPGLDAPNDLYFTCLAKSKELLNADLVRLEAMDLGDPANDNEEPSPEIEKARKDLVSARQLEKFPPDRNVMKRNCMTWAYSSRRYGFAKQLQKDWMGDLTKRVRNPDDDLEVHPFGKDRGFQASHYLGGINEQAISSVVSSAERGMNFFRKCAEALAAEGKHLQFITPMGFPLFQNYRESESGRQKIWLYDRETRVLDKTARAQYRAYNTNVNATKSGNAIAPNIIHSMDAAHLLLTVLTCQANGVKDLMVVHDSFSCQIGHASMMWANIREAFIQLYDDYCLYQDLLDQVREQLDDPDNADLPEIPEKGTLSIQDIINADYCFS